MTVLVNHNEQTVEELLLPVLEHLSKGDMDIPMLPHVANQVLLLANDHDANAPQLAVLIEQDPVLASRVLQFANSAAYGPRYPVDSLPQAISWLGLNFLAGTAFSFSVQSGVFQVHGFEKEVQGLWAHTFVVALYGRAIAERLGHNTDNAFLCGLLHAIGKPYVIHTVNCYQQDSGLRYPWAVLENVLQESYVEAGRQLAIAWELPESVKEAIMFHEYRAYEKATSPGKGAAMTCLARHLATKLFDPASSNDDSLLALPVAHFLRVSQSDMSAWLDMQETIHASVKPMLV
jgi:HD-like signal output (HDOD) protein